MQDQGSAHSNCWLPAASTGWQATPVVTRWCNPVAVLSWCDSSSARNDVRASCGASLSQNGNRLKGDVDRVKNDSHPRTTRAVVSGTSQLSNLDLTGPGKTTASRVGKARQDLSALTPEPDCHERPPVNCGPFLRLRALIALHVCKPALA